MLFNRNLARMFQFLLPLAKISKPLVAFLISFILFYGTERKMIGKRLAIVRIHDYQIVACIFHRLVDIAFGNTNT